MNANPMITAHMNSYLKKKSQHLGVTLIVMAISLALYYLGLFGTVQGPLTPGNIGERLASLGVTQTHVLMFFCLFTLLALTWNHLLNLLASLTGARLTCIGKISEGHLCGAPTRKTTPPKKRKKGTWFVCTQGHTISGAAFHPFKKGTVSHTLWVSGLIFVAILLSQHFIS